MHIDDKISDQPHDANVEFAERDLDDDWTFVSRRLIALALLFAAVAVFAVAAWMVFKLSQQTI